ncbi:hypothetical protein L1285_14625 [Pseudoalteromonas sp. DL2-H2.2]|uniref:hypothetical protein n=1 Tax=Pseudoalteromonas sp. DL2-H2.2 TaxID=2908889 RepID=UPI001F43EBC0|nr:hypothetical protein [Pseudoalteromonas sp. DL2-H2.2]MCF2909557.1 hypothetical protein [Pseudoalteromonas sp. DL2-H2.2]
MKTIIKACALIATTVFAGSAFSAQLVCEVYPKGSNAHTWGDGTPNCGGFDFSFGRSTSGRYFLTNIAKPIQEVQWNGDANCPGGTSCNATIRAYTTNSASALILYKDGTWEQTNTARANYETGH